MKRNLKMDCFVSATEENKKNEIFLDKTRQVWYNIVRMKKMFENTLAPPTLEEKIDDALESGALVAELSFPRFFPLPQIQ